MKKFFIYSLLALGLFACKKEEVQPETNNAPAGSSLPEEYQAFAGIFDGEGVGAAFNLTEDILVLINTDGDRYAWFEDREIKFVNDTDASDSPFYNCYFHLIGAGTKSTSERLYLYDDDGAFYTTGTFNPEDVSGSWDNPDLFEWWDSQNATNYWGPDNTIVFNSITAMITVSDPGSDCYDAEETYEYMWMADANGDELVKWGISDFYWPNEQVDVEDFTAENNCGGPDGIMPFESIGACCRYILPNQIQDIFFSEDGTEFCYYIVSVGEFSPIYKLY
ncbi:hypothetical protein [Sanyastnella coralliicola]|uniref:hypothetical protein n=1 Tax=Sanyastnella coralliicola TaxID=3069118 RepID=UPI0027BB1300|nr:hypothetical protein [Longitalea sp. SCSIO 12813]